MDQNIIQCTPDSRTKVRKTDGSANRFALDDISNHIFGQLDHNLPHKIIFSLSIMTTRRHSTVGDYSMPGFTTAKNGSFFLCRYFLTRSFIFGKIWHWFQSKVRNKHVFNTHNTILRLHITNIRCSCWRIECHYPLITIHYRIECSSILT